MDYLSVVMCGQLVIDLTKTEHGTSLLVESAKMQSKCPFLQSYLKHE